MARWISNLGNRKKALASCGIRLQAGSMRPKTFEDAAATLEEDRGRLGVLFRGLGGGARCGDSNPPWRSWRVHRLSWRRALGHGTERAERVRVSTVRACDFRPESRAFPERDANIALYIWLAASGRLRAAAKRGDRSVASPISAPCNRHRP